MALSRTTSSASLASEEALASQWKHEVYLSFRGIDTRYSITFAIEHELRNMRGIKSVFVDDEVIMKGTSISFELLTAIKESRFAIVVLSQNYAASAWCLEELTVILQCMKDKNRVLPVFYRVDPSEIRYQKGSCEKAFTKHESRHGIEKVKQWKDALTDVTSLSGWVSNNYMSDEELVKDIVKFVWSKIFPERIEDESTSRGFVAYGATILAMDKVMDALKDDEVVVIGVYGMCGVGKTTLVKQVGEQARQNGLFDEMVVVVISQNLDLKNIQTQLAAMLGLKLEDGTEEGRAFVLREKILRGNNLLIVLDNIWRRVEFSRIGIPNNEELRQCNSKVVLTTRIKNVCLQMECQARINLSILSEEDSLSFLWKEARGEVRESTEFYNVASKVARKCAGLPVALTAVARALEEKDLYKWKVAAKQIRVFQPADPEDEKHVFNSIKLSYDYLRYADAKSCLLLCCVFPEDYDIPIDDLFVYGMKKGLFQEFKTMQEAIATAYSVVETLKDSSLLLDSEKLGCVRMHNVVRDVAISISSEYDDLDEWEKVAELLNVSRPTTLVKHVGTQSQPERLNEQNDNPTSLPSSSAESPPPAHKHDVFLSFRGPDTRRSFTTEIYHKLQRRGVKTFMDNEDIVIGSQVSPSLLTAIEESRFAVVVLSQKYASSPWCLEELTKIVQCMVNKDRILPVYYEVEPSDVRHQKNRYGVAFMEHEEKAIHDTEKLNKWKDALRKVASISGWDTKNYKSDRELVKVIVESIRSRLRPRTPKYLMFMGEFEEFEATKHAINMVKERLKNDKVIAVGVYGEEGVGKTTMVKYVAAQAYQNGIFGHVIMAVVSQTPDLGIIQDELAEQLGVKLEAKTERERADRLRREIMSKYKLLIILDDIRDEQVLSKIGIPSCDELKTCNSKVMFIAREFEICKSMECQDIVSVNILSDEDARKLLMKRTRLSLEKSTKFSDILWKWAKECYGLPSTVIKVARALEGKDLEGWENLYSSTMREVPIDQPCDERDITSTQNPSDDGLFEEN